MPFIAIAVTGRSTFRGGSGTVCIDCRRCRPCGSAEFIELDLVRDGPPSALVHAFNLIVTGVQSDGANGAHLSVSRDMLALKSGRPVVVAPNGYETEPLADLASLAWDGRRAVPRVLANALDALADKS